MALQEVVHQAVSVEEWAVEWAPNQEAWEVAPVAPQEVWAVVWVEEWGGPNQEAWEVALVVAPQEVWAVEWVVPNREAWEVVPVVPQEVWAAVWAQNRVVALQEWEWRVSHPKWPLLQCLVLPGRCLAQEEGRSQKLQQLLPEWDKAVCKEETCRGCKGV